MKYEKELKQMLECAKGKGLGIEGIRNLINKHNPDAVKPVVKPVVKKVEPRKTLKK